MEGINNAISLNNEGISYLLAGKDAKAVDALAAFSKKNLGTITHWINNAGVNGGRRALTEVPVSQVELVVKVNLLGTLLCTKAAMAVMADQVRMHIF